eukprot:TRINITY_DN31494_c0_g1_i1.p1 TRINITY_DN31494_c0_g1~~TRINITY_DN31494_c0_g1_i1.p1  ORF type:complete len:553 (-),score=150.15 TRINITY_DN31494_c0_g1_i1:65-1723(-)
MFGGGFGGTFGVFSANEDIDEEKRPTPCNFSDLDNEPVEFISNWKVARETANIQIQTDRVKGNPVQTQTTEYREIEVQTDEVKKDIKVVPDSSEALKTFLQRVRPIMETQLDRNLISHAFDDYTVTWDEEISTISCVHELTPSPDFLSSGTGLVVTGLSWNSTGSIVAASYGRFDHDGWCVHAGILCTWNVFRRSLVPNKPDFTAETTNCLMTAEFHPREPSIVAGGTFNGRLHIWDVAQQDPVIAQSAMTDESHTEPINRIAWLKDSERRLSRLVTIGSDGRVLLWTLQQRLDTTWRLTLTQAYVLSLRAKSVGDMSAATGGTALSFNVDDVAAFVTGTEGGRLYKCALQGLERLREADRAEQAGLTNAPPPAKLPIENPVQFTFESHAAPVHSVSSSPFHRNLFLSCSADTSIRLYHALKPKSLLSLVPSASYLYCVTWSPIRPLVFAACSGDGRIFFYDFAKSKSKPVVTLEANTRKVAVQHIRFNQKAAKFLASGDSLGVVKIWQLNQHLTVERPQERAQLDALGSEQTQKPKPAQPATNATAEDSKK